MADSDERRRSRAVPSSRGRARVAWPAAGRAPAAGRVNWIFTLRLMACMGAAGVVSEVLPLQRSYWVPPVHAGGAGRFGRFWRLWPGPGRGRAAGPVADAAVHLPALADLRAEFQRTMSEPPSISRRATDAVRALLGVLGTGERLTV